MSLHGLCCHASYRVLHYVADCLSKVNSLEEYVISLFCPTLPYPTLPYPSFHSGASSVSVYINQLSQHYTAQSVHSSIHSSLYPPDLSLTPFPLTVFSPVLLKTIFPPSLPSPPFPFHLGDVMRSTVIVRHN